jgi:hypothetical protein
MLSLRGRLRGDFEVRLSIAAHRKKLLTAKFAKNGREGREENQDEFQSGEIKEHSGGSQFGKFSAKYLRFGFSYSSP